MLAAPIQSISKPTSELAGKSTRLNGRWTSRLALICAGFLICLSACSIAVYDKHWKLAEEYMREGQYRKAIEEYSRVVNYGGRSAIAVQAQKQIAVIYEDHLKNYPNAIRAYRDVIKRSDDRLVKVKARWEIARIYGDRLDRPGVAAQEYEELYREEGEGLKEGADILLEWAQTLMDSGQFKDAAARYKEFREKYPGHIDGPRSVLLEGQAYLNDRSYDQAVKIFQELLKEFKDNKDYITLTGEAYYGLGNAFESRGDIQKALEAYRESLSRYPNKVVVETKIQRVLKRSKERQF